MLIYIQRNTTPIPWAPKRDSQRKVPITETLLMNLKRHLGNRKTGYIFQSQKQRSTIRRWDETILTRRTYGRYEYRSIVRKVNKIAIQVLGRSTGTHVFRATYASHLLKAKLDLESIRKLLGHSDIKTTLIYIRALPDYNSWDEVRRVELMELEL